MQKGYKRTGKAIAVLHFFIGLIVVAIFLGAGYFCLEKMDYSNRINPDTTVRAYVEMTASPDDFDMNMEMPSDDMSGDNGGDDGENSDIVDLLPTPTPTPEPTPEPTSTPVPTPIPTPSPTPTPTPVPTPEPTRISSDLLSQSRSKGIKVPNASTDATAALTKIYVSEPNNKSFAQITGYAYLNDANFNAAKSQAFLLITPVSGNGAIAYKAKMTPSISGVTHDGALCQNPANADFEVILRVTGFRDGEYKLGVVLQYANGRKSAFTYYQFPDTFTVTGEAITTVTSPSNAPAATPAVAPDGAVVADTATGADAATIAAGADTLQGTAFGDGNPVPADAGMEGDAGVTGDASMAADAGMAGDAGADAAADAADAGAAGASTSVG